MVPPRGECAVDRYLVACGVWFLLSIKLVSCEYKASACDAVVSMTDFPPGKETLRILLCTLCFIVTLKLCE